MIQAVNISFAVNGRPILHDISFQVSAGELVVILGSNGAGKSTLLKILSGELKIAPGFVEIGGNDLNHWKQQDLAKVRAVLQQQTILTLPFLVSEVVMMGRYPHFTGRPFPIDHIIVEKALKKAGIAHLHDRDYLTLSGGEQQRVHLARVFAQIGYSSAGGPRYLFMDEPVSSLDIRHQHNTLQLAREFANEGNCAVVVLHDLNLAMQYADKILMLRHGHMVAFGHTAKTLSSDNISYAYDFPMHVLDHSYHSHPVIIPAKK